MSNKSNLAELTITLFPPQELAIMKEMKHKNVIEMYEYLDVGWMTCIFMEMCSGGDLLGVRTNFSIHSRTLADPRGAPLLAPTGSHMG